MGTHEFEGDPRNESVLISVNGELLPRPEAKVSVFDAGFLLGDGVWESFRLHNGTIAFADEHMDRLFRGAESISMDIGRTREQILDEVNRVIEANDMHDGVHVRLVVTRGLKPTPYQAPWVISSPPTLVIMPEYKIANEQRAVEGIRLVTVDVRRGEQNVQDPRINSLSKHNCIAACVDAAAKGGEEGLMLDPAGNVATCNSTHFFIVKDGEVWTSSGDYCLDGITRGVVIEIARNAGITVRERNFSLTHVYGADEAFTTGTFAGVAPIGSIDGRVLGDQRGPMVERLQQLYLARLADDVSGKSRP